jgi:hypothetical protein
MSERLPTYPANRYRAKFVHADVEKFELELAVALSELRRQDGVEIIGVRTGWVLNSSLLMRPEVCTVIEYLLPGTS